MFIVGKIIKPQGLKGEVKVEVITSFPEHFNDLDIVFIKKNEYEPLQIESSRLENNFLFVKFKEIQSRNDAESFRNYYLYIPEEKLRALKDDEFYHHQLLGMEVVSEDGTKVGIITDIENYPAHDMLVVLDSSKETHLIPIIKSIIKKIDIESQKVTIYVMEGLLG